MNLARPLHASQSALQAWLLQGDTGIAADVAGEVVPAVPQHRGGFVVRITVHRLGIDDQPRFTVGGEHILVVQVAVNDRADAGGVGGQLAAERDRLFDQPAG